MNQQTVGRHGRPDLGHMRLISGDGMIAADIAADSAAYRQPCDPRVSGAGRDFRPDDYVAAFAERATRLVVKRETE